MRNHKKRLSIIVILCIFAIGITFHLLNVKNLSKSTLIIGVYNLNDPTKKYDELKNDIENHLNTKIKFIELIPGNDDGEPERVKYLSKLLSQSKVDLILGAPNSYTQQLINEDLFMDITDYIENIDHLQKGVIDIAKKIGKGRIYSISPIITQWYCLFENMDLLDELDIQPINSYISWDEFLSRLKNIEDRIKVENKDYKPLAMIVQNEGEESTFIEDDFLMYGYGLDAPLVEQNILLGNEKWSDFFMKFCNIIKKYGSNYENINQKYIFNTHFSEGGYVTTLGSFYQLELYTNDNLGLNEKMPTKIKTNFRVNIVPIPVYPGDEGMVNIRLSSIAISKKSNQKERAIKVLNYILSKEYTMKMINHRYEYNNLGFGVPFFPAYYDDEIIGQLNKMYDYLFDVNWIYQATKGSVTYPMYDLEKREKIYEILSNAFADVFNDTKNDDEALKSVKTFIQ